MDAKVENLSGVFLVTLSGQLDFESADSLKARCTTIFNQKNVIFNLKGLNFVGSSGLTPFLDLLRELLKANGNRLKICAVSSEFMRLFEAGELNGLEVYENSSQARLAFDYAATQAAIATGPAPTGAAVNAAMDLVGSIGLDVKMLEEEP